MSLAAGSKLGPYKILAPIGEGGMGEVYRARDTKLDRDVAIKVLPAALAQDAEGLARFEREVKVLAALNHPNIAQIYGVEESGGVGALLMELVPGESLKGPLPLETALNYAKQIADALEAAHAKGIVHRDLKPANIMVTTEGVVKVLDFGLAARPTASAGDPSNPANSPTLTISPTRAGMILGTAAYMSPEQARGKPVDSDHLRREYDFMNLSPKKLAEIEFKLSLTPTGVAARYIAWLHDALGTDAPKPLSAWLKELAADIRQHYPHFNPYRLFRGAEREVFTLVGLYASALHGWIEDSNTTLLLNIAATGCSNAGSRSSPELAARLAEQRKHLRVWAAVIKIIEDDYLRETVLPVALRSALDPEQLKFSSAMARNALERAPASEAKAATAEARSRVKTLFDNAYATGSIFQCNTVLFSFAQAISAYDHRRRDYELAMSVMESTRGRTAPMENGAERAPQQPLPNKRSKPRGSARAPTSATQPEEPKTGRMKEMAFVKATSSNPGGEGPTFLTLSIFGHSPALRKLSPSSRPPAGRPTVCATSFAGT
jgi:hypothetical protein